MPLVMELPVSDGKSLKKMWHNSSQTFNREVILYLFPFTVLKCAEIVLIILLDFVTKVDVKVEFKKKSGFTFLSSSTQVRLVILVILH